MTKSFIRCVHMFLLFFCFLFTAGAVQAKGIAPVRGTDFVVSKDRMSIHVRRSASRFDLRELATLAGTTVSELREMNPESTLAVCITKDRWLYDPDGNRSSHRVWDKCPEEQRYIDFVPGEKLQLSHLFGEAPPTPKSPPSTTDGEESASPSPTPTVTPIPPESPPEPGRSFAPLPATVSSSRGESKETLRAELASAKQRVAALEREAQQRVVAWPWVLATAVLLVIAIVLGGFGHRMLQTKNVHIKELEDNVAELDGQLGSMNSSSIEAAERAQQLEGEFQQQQRVAVERERQIGELQAQLTESQQQVMERDAQMNELRTLFAGNVQKIFAFIGLTRKVDLVFAPSMLLSELSIKLHAHAGLFNQYLSAVEAALVGEREAVERSYPSDWGPVQALLRAFDRIKGERDELVDLLERDRPTPPVPESSSRPRSDHPPSRVPTLPHGLEAAGDVLMQPGQVRDQFIEQIGSFALAVRRCGEFPLFTRGEMNTLHDLATMLVRVRLGDDFQLLQLAEMHDAAFVAELQPCNGMT